MMLKVNFRNGIAVEREPVSLVGDVSVVKVVVFLHGHDLCYEREVLILSVENLAELLVLLHECIVVKTFLLNKRTKVLFRHVTHVAEWINHVLFVLIRN